MKFKVLHNAVHQGHKLIAQSLSAGQVAVDATAGNGHDTLFLAQLVGPEGKVYAFDIQQQALDNTKARLAEAGCSGRVELLLIGHEQMKLHVSEPVHAVMFNLGYLPGTDHQVITQPDNTLKALHGAVQMLAPGGILSVVVYPGHSGGDQEAQQVDDWARSLSSQDFAVMRMQFWNRQPTVPYLLVIEKSAKWRIYHEEYETTQN